MENGTHLRGGTMHNSYILAYNHLDKVVIATLSWYMSQKKTMWYSWGKNTSIVILSSWGTHDWFLCQNLPNHFWTIMLACSFDSFSHVNAIPSIHCQTEVHWSWEGGICHVGWIIELNVAIDAMLTLKRKCQSLLHTNPIGYPPLTYGPISTG